MRFRAPDAQEAMEYHVNGRQLVVVDVPVGYAHCVENTGKTDLVMLLWATKQGIDIPPALTALRDRMMAREAVQTAMRHEGLN